MNLLEKEIQWMTLALRGKWSVTSKSSTVKVITIIIQTCPIFAIGRISARSSINWTSVNWNYNRVWKDQPQKYDEMDKCLPGNCQTNLNL